MSAPLLAHLDPRRPLQVETDASDFTMGAVLSQPDDAGTLHPVAYYLRKFSAPEIIYPLYDKELATTEWRPYLARTQHCIQDHKNLLYITTSHTLN